MGRFDELVAALTLATPSGVLELGHPPATAAGPTCSAWRSAPRHARRHHLGDLRVRPKPAATNYEGWSFRTWPAGLAALQRLARHDLLPDVVRLSDADETRANLLMASGAAAKACAAACAPGSRGRLHARARLGGACPI